MKNNKLLVGGIALSFVVMPMTQAIAGFQFTAPVQQVQPQQPVPPLSDALLPQVPIIQMEGDMPAAPMGDVQGGPVSLLPSLSENSTPRAPQTGISSLAPRQATPVTSQQEQKHSGQSYAMAVGFGKNLPLVTALRQVVPPEYTYVVDDSIPMSATVSWDGGRPWNVVLNDMVAPLDLKTSISGSRVSIGHSAPMTQMAMAEPVQIQPASTRQEITPVAEPISWAPREPEEPSPAPTPRVYEPVAQTYAPPVVQEVAVQPQPTIEFTAPAPAPVSRIVPKVTRGTWVANKGDSLRSVLEEWSAQAGSDMFWSSDYDYPLAGTVNVSGSFEEAVQNLLQGFEQARPKPVARLHPNLPHGPAVLVVETLQSLD